MLGADRAIRDRAGAAELAMHAYGVADFLREGGPMAVIFLVVTLLMLNLVY